MARAGRGSQPAGFRVRGESVAGFFQSLSGLVVSCIRAHHNPAHPADLAFEVLPQPCPNPLALVGGQDVGVAQEGDITHILEPHDAHQGPADASAIPGQAVGFGLPLSRSHFGLKVLRRG